MILNKTVRSFLFSGLVIHVSSIKGCRTCPPKHFETSQSLLDCCQDGSHRCDLRALIACVTYMLSLGGLQRLGRVVVELVPTESRPVFGPRCHLQRFNRQLNISPKHSLINQALLNVDLEVSRLWLEKQKQTWLKNHEATVWNVYIFTWQRLLCRLKTFRNMSRPKTLKTDISKKWGSGKKRR